jgi:hypothetical protein
MSSSPDLPRRSAADASADPRAWITPEDLNVAPALLGLPLASPWRRALAMGLDLGLLALLSQWGSTTLLLGLAWLAWRLGRLNMPAPGRPRGRWLGGGTLPALLLVGLGLWSSAWPDADAPRTSAPPSQQEAAQADDDLAQAGELVTAALAAASQAGGSDAQAGELARLRLETQAARQEIKGLKAQVRQLKDEARLDPREKLRRWWDKVGMNLAWALAYFVCWPLVWPGQTPGKRLLGLQVVELTGKPMKAMLNLRRYGGYAAGMATGGLGLAQILWDANRQGLQDKAAHTAVIDLRNPQRLRLGPGEARA